MVTDKKVDKLRNDCERYWPGRVKSALAKLSAMYEHRLTEANDAFEDLQATAALFAVNVRLQHYL